MDAQGERMAHTVSLNQYAVRKRHLFDWRLLKEHETEPASALNPKSVAKLVVPDLEQTAIEQIVRTFFGIKRSPTSS